MCMFHMARDQAMTRASYSSPRGESRVSTVNDGYVAGATWVHGYLAVRRFRAFEDVAVAHYAELGYRLDLVLCHLPKWLGLHAISIGAFRNAVLCGSRSGH